jgi:hypothetical protein
LAPVNVNLQSATAQPRRLVAVTNTNPGAHTIVINNVNTATDPNKITLDFIAWLN